MNLTASLRPVYAPPSYEELVRCPGTTGLAAALRAMRPGDVLDATDLTNARAKRQAIAESAFSVFGGRGHIVTRLVDGRYYVARLRPEDWRRKAGA